MAGSYRFHLKGGDVRLLENGKDIGEAMHELIWLVERAIGIQQVELLLDSEYYPMSEGRMPKDEAFAEADRIMCRDILGRDGKWVRR